MMKTDATLVLVCKRPALGHGKQRLAKSLSESSLVSKSTGAEQALVIANCLLACALEDLNDWPGNKVISPAHVRDLEWAKTLLKSPVQVLAQVDGNLGERLNYLDKKLRAEGHEKLIFIGSDAPILSALHYQEISTALESHDIALCPAQDGGVTIMANKIAWPNMKNLAWSTEQFDTSLTLLCQQQQLSVTHTQSSYDVDTRAQLTQLYHDLKLDKRPARQKLLHEIKLLLEA